MSPFDSGETISALTEMDPADSPAIVTRAGSPPKAAMFFCTHSQRRHLVEQAVVARRVLRRLLRQLGMGQEPEHVQAVVDGQGDDAPARHRLAVVSRLRAVAGDESAAVEVDQHREPGTAAAFGVQTFR